MIEFAESIEYVSTPPFVGLDLLQTAGQPQLPDWEPVRVSLVTEESGRRLTSVDCPAWEYALPVIKDARLLHGTCR